MNTVSSREATDPEGAGKKCIINMLRLRWTRARSLMEKALGFEPRDWGFDSLRARQPCKEGMQTHALLVFHARDRWQRSRNATMRELFAEMA